jgi:hypothetical protein
MSSSVRDRLNAIKKSPVTTQLMPDIFSAAKQATVNGYSSAQSVNFGDNIITGTTLFDTAIDGNNTTSENMNAITDGLNLRVYRIDEARIMNPLQGFYPIEEIIPICFCPTFAFMKDLNIGQESIDDQRENLRLATMAIYSSKNFRDKYVNNVLVYRHTQPEIQRVVPMSTMNYIMNFENKMKINSGNNWYSAPFTLLFSVVVKDFI